MTTGFDPYRELGLSPDAATEPELVRAAFKALAKKYHPDGYSDVKGKAAAEEKMRRLNEAQRMILSGEYLPPPPSDLAVVRGSAAPPSNAGANASAKAALATARPAAPKAPLLVATLVLLASFVVPVLFARDHLADAARLEEKGEWSLALEEANQAVKDDPRNGEAYLLRARLWQKLNQPERARVDLANAQGLVPSPQWEKARQDMAPPTPTAVVSPTATRSPATWRP